MGAGEALMGYILVLNCGSSSVKYALFDSHYRQIVKGTIAQIGEGKPTLTHSKLGSTLNKPVDAATHAKAISLMLDLLHDPAWGAIKANSEIKVIGHRMVHGGSMIGPTRVSAASLKKVVALSHLAPLHNPHNIKGIMAAGVLLPGVPQVMVFDTEFHHTLPKEAYLYPLPYEFFSKYGIRRYGFHGISHMFVAQEAASMLHKPRPNLITCHLGAGSSITAVASGKSVDTSMGMTPLEGVMMATRTGDIDPAILQYLVKWHGFKYENLFELMNNKSGLLGISGQSKDMREILQKANSGNKRCKLAVRMYCYRIAKYVGAYVATLGRVDAIVFTGGIGENAPQIRKEISAYLTQFGMHIDPALNKIAVGVAYDISAKGSETRILSIPTNEELMIAKESTRVLRG